MLNMGLAQQNLIVLQAAPFKLSLLYIPQKRKNDEFKLMVMNTSEQIENPYVKFSENVVEINYRRKKVKFAVNSISKIYLSKRKADYLSSLLENLHVTRSANFKLYIQSLNNSTIVLDIAADDKYYFVRLVSRLRNEINKLKTTTQINGRTLQFRNNEAQVA